MSSYKAHPRDLLRKYPNTYILRNTTSFPNWISTCKITVVLQVIKSNQYFFLLQYHRKIVRLWEKYDCFTNSAKQKQMQSSHHGCPKSQSFYTPPANAMSNLVQVTHNPDTNLTTTNVASPQTPKTHTLSTEASRVRKFKVLCIKLVRAFLSLISKPQIKVVTCLVNNRWDAKCARHFCLIHFAGMQGRWKIPGALVNYFYWSIPAGQHKLGLKYWFEKNIGI